MQELLTDRVRPGPAAGPRPSRERTLDGQWELSLTVTAPSLAPVRRLVRAHLHYWELLGVLDVTLLGVTELLTNVLKHTRSHDARLLMRSIHNGVYVAVRDDDPGMPMVRSAGPDSGAGRGLAVLQTLADGFGISAGETGKDVWFRVEDPAGGDASC